MRTNTCLFFFKGSLSFPLFSSAIFRILSRSNFFNVYFMNSLNSHISYSSAEYSPLIPNACRQELNSSQEIVPERSSSNKYSSLAISCLVSSTIHQQGHTHSNDLQGLAQIRLRNLFLLVFVCKPEYHLWSHPYVNQPVLLSLQNLEIFIAIILSFEVSEYALIFFQTSLI